MKTEFLKFSILGGLGQITIFGHLGAFGGICGKIDVFWHILAKTPHLIVAGWKRIEESLLVKMKKIKKHFFLRGGGGQNYHIWAFWARNMFLGISWLKIISK